MKLERIGELLNLYQFSLGGIAYCIGEMRPRLKEEGNSEALELADKTLEKTRAARQQRYDWDQRKRQDPLKREGTKELDNRIDQTLSGLLKVAESLADLELESERTRLAEEFVDDLFPSGVYPITSKTFADQQFAVAELIERMKGDYAEHVEKMKVKEYVQQLESLNTEFGELLAPAHEGVSYDEVESSFQEAENLFHGLIGKIMGAYYADTDTLNRVMKPVLEQTERTRRHLKRRGTIPEVDPETGEPVEPTDGGSSGDGDSSGGGNSDG